MIEEEMKLPMLLLFILKNRVTFNSIEERMGRTGK